MKTLFLNLEGIKPFSLMHGNALLMHLCASVCVCLCEPKSATWPSSGKTQLDRIIFLCSTGGWGGKTSITFASLWTEQCKTQSRKHRLSLQMTYSMTYNTKFTSSEVNNLYNLSADKHIFFSFHFMELNSQLILRTCFWFQTLANKWDMK